VPFPIAVVKRVGEGVEQVSERTVGGEQRRVETVVRRTAAGHLLDLIAEHVGSWPSLNMAKELSTTANGSYD
jgi:hypothetical protein